jgi:hypothetical protein
MAYTLTHLGNSVQRDDGLVIPFADGNADYEQYKVWLAEGNTPDPYIEPPAPIPTTVTMRQARLALHQGGLLTTVNAAIAAGAEADKITWEYATEVKRDDALVTNMATALNLTETDLDNLFTLAGTL